MCGIRLKPALQNFCLPPLAVIVIKVNIVDTLMTLWAQTRLVFLVACCVASEKQLLFLDVINQIQQLSILQKYREIYLDVTDLISSV